MANRVGTLGLLYGDTFYVVAIRRRVQWWIIHEFGVADEGIRKSTVPWHSVGAVFWDIPCGSDDELVGIGLYARARKTICYAREAKEASRQANRDHQPTDDRTVSLRYDSWTLIFSPNTCVCVTRDAQFRWLLTKSIRTSAQYTGAIHPWEQQRNRSAILTAVAFEKETNAEKQINTSISYHIHHLPSYAFRFRMF